jgi:SulP family sulfate permease
MEQPISNNKDINFRGYHVASFPSLKNELDEDNNLITPQEVRYETLSWIDREFNPDRFNPSEALNDGSSPSEIKIVYGSSMGDEKLIEMNNKNNTMNNKRKTEKKYIASPPKLVDEKPKFSNDNSSCSSSSPTITELSKTEELENQKTENQSYSNYGTFSNPIKNQNLNYEPLNNNFNNNKFNKKDSSNEYFIIDHDFNKTAYNSYQNSKEKLYSVVTDQETNIIDDSETTPLTASHNHSNSPYKSNGIVPFLQTWSIQCIKFLPAVLLGVLLNLLDSLSYGIIIFPKHESMPSTYVQSGISMFLVSTIVAQLVYASGLSKFKGGNGSMMIEVMPFLHIICQTIIEKIGADKPKEIIATVMVAYAISTILTGLVFYLLGTFKMGNIMSFFPRHILIGCIGGIGLFLVQTGIEIITGYSFELGFTYIKNIFTTPTLPIWLISITLAFGLSIVHTKIHHPLLVPTFFITLPVIFYLIVWIGGFNLDELREQGWLFNLISDDGHNDVPFYTFWTYFDFKATQWSVIPYTLSTIFALVFFGILHVPINVPALSVSVNTEVDINKELKIHGYTNFISGLIGSLQNYLVYSNSVLFIRSGGNSNIAGFMLALGTFALLVVGTSFIKYVPTIIIGGLIFHLGIDLMKEALVDTFKTVSPIEYLTIVLIVVCMDVWGFTQGIIVGIIVACIFFIITLSRRRIIRSVHSGPELPSTVYRLRNQRTFLNDAGIQIKVIRFQGFIFFGTFQQINDYINNMILKTDSYDIKYINFDFKLVSGMDYSASEAFIKIKSNLKKRKIYLILCNVQPSSIDPLNRVGFLSNIDDDDNNEYFEYFNNYDSAIEWCENMLLETQYDASKRIYVLKTLEDGSTRLLLTRESVYNNSNNYSSSSSNNNINRMSAFTPSPSPITPLSACKSVVKTNINEFEQPLKLLIHTLLNENNEVDMNVFTELTRYFKCFEIKKDKILWDKTTPAFENQIYIVESGQALLYTVNENSNHVIKEKVTGTLVPYSVIGEVEFFSKLQHRTKLVAQGGSKLWSINYSNYESLCNSHPDIALKFIQLILQCSSGRMENVLKHDLIKSLY